VTCIRLDASVVACHSGKEGAEPNFKGSAEAGRRDPASPPTVYPV